MTSPARRESSLFCAELAGFSSRPAFRDPACQGSPRHRHLGWAAGRDASARCPGCAAGGAACNDPASSAPLLKMRPLPMPSGGRSRSRCASGAEAPAGRGRARRHQRRPVRACGTTRPVPEARRPLRSWKEATSRPRIPYRFPRSENLGAIGVRHFLMRVARIVASGVVRIELRDLLPEKEIIEIHAHAPRVSGSTLVSQPREPTEKVPRDERLVTESRPMT